MRYIKFELYKGAFPLSEHQYEDIFSLILVVWSSIFNIFGEE